LSADFQIGNYDRSRPLIIDPTMEYSTYLGGGGPDGAGNRGGTDEDGNAALAVDEDGNAYIAGDTRSANFPTAAGAFQTTPDSELDAFVSKLSPDGKTLIYSTYLGGADDDTALGIAVDGDGRTYVAGETYSPNFPTTAGAFQTIQPSSTGASDGFVTRLSADGKSLSYSTYLGGDDFDKAVAVAVDSLARVYVTGNTSSGDFPTTAGAFDTTLPGGSWDAFACRLNADGKTLSYSTFLGGSDGFDDGLAIAVNSTFNTYVGGATSSTNFPTTAAAFQTDQDSRDGFVTKLSPDGKSLVYSTYLGGSGKEDFFAPSDEVTGIAVDADGNAFVVGRTASTDFPTTAGAFQQNGGLADAFISKLTADGSGLLFSTYLGGATADFGQSIALGDGGSAWVTGITYSVAFPKTADAGQLSNNGGGDAFITNVSADGTTLLYSSFLGGSGRDYGLGVAADTSGAVFAAGYTGSANFPVTAGAFQTTPRGGGDLFIVKFASPEPPHTPEAAAGPDRTVTTRKKKAKVKLDGTASTDPDGDPLKFTWTEAGRRVGKGPKPRVSLKAGPHTITLTVSDPAGNTDTDDVVITVTGRAR
jgi:hypothetical protein